MTQINRDHSEQLIRAVSRSPDGARLVTASRQQSLRGSHTIADAELRGVSPVESAAQADRASEQQGGATVWDVDTGAPLLSYRGHPHGANDVAWSPDGRRVASAGGPDGTAQVWDADNGRLLITYPDRPQAAPEEAEESERSRKVLVSIAAPYEAGLMTTSQAARWVQTLRWSPTGHRIASTHANEVHLWEADTGRHVLTYGNHRAHVQALAWSPDGARVASLTGWLVQIWDAVEQGHVLRIYRGHAGDGASVTALAWSPVGTYAATGSSSGVVRVWDSTTGETVRIYHGHSPASSYVTDPSNTPKSDPAAKQRMMMEFLRRTLGDERFTATTEPSVASRLLQEYIEKDRLALRTPDTKPQEITATERITPRISAVAWSPDGTRVASASWDRTVQIWDAFSGDHLSTYREHASAVTAVAWSPDGSKIASADGSGAIHVWSVTQYIGRFSTRSGQQG